MHALDAVADRQAHSRCSLHVAWPAPADAMLVLVLFSARDVRLQVARSLQPSCGGSNFIATGLRSRSLADWLETAAASISRAWVPRAQY